ncbi:radical SAM/SPASM domain-containing protein [Ascidiimonas sp. W6]|uniref:radical SAM/SPASM domain-containing protein n=1 Tax=Ascidiimonas meishanensis TaxID=3128903 RepID=UPI0030EBE8A7
MQDLKNNAYSHVIDLDRIHHLERGSKELIIDRINGKWVMLPKGVSALLPVLSMNPDTLSNQRLKDSSRQLSDILLKQGIGSTMPLQHETLNTVILKLTKACNLGCSYCYDFEKEDKARHQQLEITLSAIYQAIDMADKKINFILHGGEPMLVWEMVKELVIKGHQYGQAKGVQVYFIGQTNLTRVDQEKIDFSRKFDIRWGVSIDGPPNINDKFRITHNGKGSLSVLLEAIDAFPTFISRCNAMSTITSANHTNLPEVAHYIMGLGFSGWDWTLFQAIGRGRNQTVFDYDIDLLLKSWDALFDEVLSGVFDSFPIEPILKYLRNFLDGPVYNMCMRSKCGAGRDLLSVSFDGTVEACDCIDPCGPLASLGHVTKGGLKQAYSTPKADLIRSRDVETLQCGSCLWQAVCGGTCMARAGGIEKISKDECLMSLHIFDRISLSLSQSDALIKYRKSCD